METDGYRIQTESFEGPLDLLLHLIRKNKMDIMEIELSKITSEYLFYLKDKKRINPSREGDFLMTASTLIYIKSRSLLPKPEMLQEQSAEDRLISTLIEYDKIQKISKLLQELEGETLLLWKREKVVEEKFHNKEYKLEEISSFQLAELFLNVIKKKEEQEFLYIDSKKYSIEKKWEEIMKVLEKDGFMDFFKYLNGLTDIVEILVSFFTILEMIKQRIIIAAQKDLFAPISIWKNDTDGIVVQ